MRDVILGIKSRSFALTSICSIYPVFLTSNVDLFLIADKQTKFLLYSNNCLVSRKSRWGERASEIKEDDTLWSHDPQDRRYDRRDSVESGSKEDYTLSTPLIRLHFFFSRSFFYIYATQSIQAFGFSTICIRTRVIWRQAHSFRPGPDGYNNAKRVAVIRKPY